MAQPEKNIIIITILNILIICLMLKYKKVVGIGGVDYFARFSKRFLLLLALLKDSLFFSMIIFSLACLLILNKLDLRVPLASVKSSPLNNLN